MSRSYNHEPARVHAELVEALFTAVVPFTIMTVTFACVGSFIVAQSGDSIAIAATLVGLVSALGKAWLHLWFRHEPRSPLDGVGATMWERRFAIANLSFAAALGTLAARSFALPTPAPPLLATGMLFGFCSGQVARLAGRVRLCSVSICVAAVPCAMAAAAHGGTGYLGLAAMFALFMLGSMETVRHAYDETRQRISANIELAGVASLDPLTGLNNRLGLRRAIAERLPQLAAFPKLLCVHCFDLDGFKAVNDRHGHAAGDAILVELGRRLQSLLREGDIAARMGGDEFVVLQTGLTHADEAEMFAHRLCRSITAPYAGGQRILEVGMSIGSCTGQPDEGVFVDLLAVADQRMYAAKQAGGGVHHAFSRSIY